MTVLKQHYKRKDVIVQERYTTSIYHCL